MMYVILWALLGVVPAIPLAAKHWWDGYPITLRDAVIILFTPAMGPIFLCIAIFSYMQDLSWDSVVLKGRVPPTPRESEHG